MVLPIALFPLSLHPLLPLSTPSPNLPKNLRM
jgi:hypothetical protein